MWLDASWHATSIDRARRESPTFRHFPVFVPPVWPSVLDSFTCT